MVRQLKDTSDKDLTVGGSGLAAEALKFGLVNELHRFPSYPSSSVEANTGYPTAYAWISNCWTCGDSQAGRCTSDTDLRHSS